MRRKIKNKKGTMSNNIQKWYKIYDGPWTPCKEEDVFTGGYEFFYTPKDKHPYEIMKLKIERKEDGRSS